MSYRISMLSLIFLLCCVNARGQTDIGSPSSAGAVTTNQSLAALTPERRLELQEKQLSVQLEKLEIYVRQASPKSLSLSLSDDQRQNVLKSYETFRKTGHEMSPFDFLASTIALQRVPSGNLPNKNATAVRAALETNGIKSSNIMLFAEVEGGGEAQPSGQSVSKQYKESLNKAKEQLRKALK